MELTCFCSETPRPFSLLMETLAPPPPTEPTANHLTGFPPIPPQLILLRGIVMQIRDA